MNESNQTGPEADDELLRKLLGPLRQLEPPLEARLASRLAVADELRQRVNVSPQRPWWRRSISVPVPVIAAGLVLAALLIWNDLREPEPTSARIAAEGHTDRKPRTSAPAPDARSAPPHRAAYYAKEIYVCGVGRVNSEVHYFQGEQDHE
jgi:hypothetical protein